MYPEPARRCAAEPVLPGASRVAGVKQLAGATALASRGVTRGTIRQKATGLGLVGAIFVITVLAILSAAMARMVETGARTYTLEILSAKAFRAAESGAELGTNAVFAPNGAGSCGTTTFSFSDEALRRCTAAVTCGQVAAGGETFYTVTSVGTCDAVDVSAQRTVQVGAKL